MRRSRLGWSVAVMFLGSLALTCGKDRGGGAGDGGQGGAGGQAGAGGHAGGGGSGQGGRGGGGDQGGRGGQGGNFGAGGQGGNFGQGGQGGNFGAGGQGGMPFVLPACLRDLIAPCPTSGACRSHTTDAGSADLYCYAAGSQLEITINELCTASDVSPGHTLLTVRKPDGSLCYTYEISNVFPGQACESGTLTWRDAAGQVVASGSFSFDGSVTITCPGSNQFSRCFRATQDCNLSIDTAPCSPGACP